MRTTLRSTGFVAAIVMAAMSASAHHGWSGQGGEQMEVKGTVHKPVSLTNPHASMQVMVEGQVWDITLAPASRSEGAGLTSKTFAAGDAVTVRGNRSTDAKRNEIKAVRVSAAGRNYDLYPERLR